MTSRMAIYAVLLLASSTTRGDEDSAGIPPPFRPFEHLVGAWEGQAIPQSNRLRGWTEHHRWAWAFREGRVIGMSVELEANKTLAAGRLSYDPAKKVYRLEGKTPGGQPATFAGPIDPKGQTLMLQREGKTPSGQERLTLRLNRNRIRYTLLQEAKAPGAPQWAKVIDANLGKEGEAFAAGGKEEDLPKCIVTGGAATLSATYQGKTYPLCCTGCRDEFEADPEKYVKKLAQRIEKGAIGKPKAPARRGDDDAFEGLVEDRPEARPER